MVSYFKKITKVEWERNELKGLVEMMTRERTVIHGRKDIYKGMGKVTVPISWY